MGNGGAARAGCMGFSLIGVLVSVGLVVWLGSRAFDGATGTATPPAQNPFATAPEASTPTVHVVAEPSTDLTGDASITVSASNLQPGEKVTVIACAGAMDSIPGEIGHGDIGPGDVGPCDTTTEITTTASAAGKVEVRFGMPRVVRASGLPIDCAADAGRCEVQVWGMDSAARGRLPVSFAEGLDPPDLLSDLGG